MHQGFIAARITSYNVCYTKLLRSLSVSSFAGEGAERYLEEAGSIDPNTERHSCRPAVRAIRSGEIQVVQETAADPCLPWRERALAFGYLSAISLPLRAGDQLIGTLSINAAESGGFGEQEVALLSELADDMGYGIHVV